MSRSASPHHAAPSSHRPAPRAGWAASLILSAVVVLIGFAACTEDDAQEGLCEPGASIFCRCPGGNSGNKICDESGSGFGPCEPCEDRPTGTTTGTGTGTGVGGSTSSTTTGTGGGGTGGTGGGCPGPGADPLYAPCEDHCDCQTEYCPMGYCTKPCAVVTDCDTGVAECVTFGGMTACMPVCTLQTHCDPFGCADESLCSQCGYTQAVDGWPVLTCADWGANLALPPPDTECTADEQCNLGLQGMEYVCHTFGVCTEGCYQPVDCPAGTQCSSQGAIGTCN